MEEEDPEVQEQEEEMAAFDPVRMQEEDCESSAADQGPISVPRGKISIIPNSCLGFRDHVSRKTKRSFSTSGI